MKKLLIQNALDGQHDEVKDAEQQDGEKQNTIQFPRHRGIVIIGHVGMGRTAIASLVAHQMEKLHAGVILVDELNAIEHIEQRKSPLENLINRVEIDLRHNLYDLAREISDIKDDAFKKEQEKLRRHYLNKKNIYKRK